MSTNLIELRILNFRDLIKIDVPDISGYTFSTLTNGERKHAAIVGYCTDCEEKGCNYAVDDKSYRLTNISHGTHSSDVFAALMPVPDTSDWYQEPVVFVFEGPSRNYEEMYKEVSHNGYNKCPSQYWYWIWDQTKQARYPEHFQGRTHGYGEFVLSAIQTFRLANVYITNCVKCSLNNNQGKSAAIDHYDPEAVENCRDKFLKKELDIMTPRVVFAMGNQVADRIAPLVPSDTVTQLLPHPAAHFSQERFQTSYFQGMVRALQDAKMISPDELRRLAMEFPDQFDEKSS